MRLFNNDWDLILQEETDKPYFKELLERIDEEYRLHTVYPPRDEIFRALQETPYQSTKVVILGQDPYHGRGQAQGLSFSVRPGVTIPHHCATFTKSWQPIWMPRFRIMDP